MGLFSLNVVSAVMSGLGKDMARRIVDTKGEIRIYHRDFSPILHYSVLMDSLQQKYPEIVAIGGVSKNDFLLRRRHFTAYTENFSIDYHRHQAINNIFHQLRIGEIDESAFQDKGIIIGLETAFSLIATVGDSVDIVSPSILVPTPLGLLPKTEKYRVVGIFLTGLPEYDNLYSFIDHQGSEGFRRHSGVDFLEVKTKIKSTKFGKFVKQIEKDFPHLRAEHWEIFDKTLFQAIKVEKIALFSVMAIIIILASFNVTGNFIRTVTEKKTEISLLHTLGMPKKEIFALFINMGLMISTVAVIMANILSCTAILLQAKFEVLKIPIPGFPFTAVPVDFSILRLFLFSLMTVMICLLGSLYPAYKTMTMNIIDVLHQEE